MTSLGENSWISNNYRGPQIGNNMVDITGMLTEYGRNILHKYLCIEEIIIIID